jgi:hypothetical protein
VNQQGSASPASRDRATRASPRAGQAVSAIRRVSHDAKWTQADAIALCRQVEAICPGYGCHVALTGGTLYRDGERKDCDILFYRIRQSPAIDVDGLFVALANIGIVRGDGFGWCIQATYGERKIDCFFPEEDGEYPTEETENDLEMAA